MPKPISRRNFLKLLMAAGGALLTGYLGLQHTANSRSIPGRLLGPSTAKGHRIRDHRFFPAPAKTIQHEVVIVGGGISGLSAAWWLQKQGFTQFTLLEMESNVGGNSRSGKNEISAYPWAAHYVPIPGPDAKLVRSLFEELGVIRGYDKAGKPIYEELFLCHEPDERLYKEGHWQDGLVPFRGTSDAERAELDRFFARIESYRTAIGKDGKRAFAVPLAMSSQDAEYLKLDRLSMSQWMAQEGFHSKPLNWYVNYCCRDDYGATPDQISAWAGIHYFASRYGEAANAEPQSVLTWPEGNGWLVSRLKEKLNHYIETDVVVHRIDSNESHTTVDFLDGKTGQVTRIQAKAVIFAAPRFVGKHIVQPLQRQIPTYMDALAYSPWLVANVSVKQLPGGEGAPLAWDNVNYHNESLGYVVATHQKVTQFQSKTVLTYYRPLTHLPPRLAREEAYKKSFSDWTEWVVSDLKTMHSNIESDIESIDVWVWGHGMIRPSVGFIWGQQRQEMLKPVQNIYFAHSDMSGISIFEEAQYHGVEAAKNVLRQLGVA